MGTTEALARYIAQTNYEDLPAEVVTAAKIGILDGIANLLAGATQPVAKLVSDYTQELGGSPVSSVIGHGYKTNPLNAAFANGVSGHCMDFELQGEPSSHGTSSILPGPLALAEAQGGASGKQLIVAYTLGWDVQQRILTACYSAGANLRGFHPPGVFGPLGGTASAAKMLKLNQAQVQMALGIGASRTGGLFANNGTMVKSTHPGKRRCWLARDSSATTLFSNHHGATSRCCSTTASTGTAFWPTPARSFICSTPASTSSAIRRRSVCSR
jgi:2-methylcitrate dehydratase PrpD